MHGGHVTGSSEGVGRGATFAIYLPMPGDEGVPRGSISQETNVRRCILVVDDNRDAADSTATLLEFEGHQVKAVYTAEAALVEVERLRPNLVLLDIGLPGISGYELVQRIKAAHPLMCVVAVTGYGRPEDRQRSEAAGFDAHLVKPVDFEVLRQLMGPRKI
jgi:CheY-like chemotaxis protein